MVLDRLFSLPLLFFYEFMCYSYTLVAAFVEILLLAIAELARLPIEPFEGVNLRLGFCMLLMWPMAD